MEIHRWPSAHKCSFTGWLLLLFTSVYKAAQNNEPPYVCRPQTSPASIWGSSSAVASHCGRLKRGGTRFSMILSSPSKRHFAQQFDTTLALWNTRNEPFIAICLARLAWQAMRQLHPEAIAAIQSKALFSQAEEALLAKISSVSKSFRFCCGDQPNFSINIDTTPLPE